MFELRKCVLKFEKKNWFENLPCYSGGNTLPICSPTISFHPSHSVPTEEEDEGNKAARSNSATTQSQPLPLLCCYCHHEYPPPVFFFPLIKLVPAGGKKPQNYQTSITITITVRHYIRHHQYL